MSLTFLQKQAITPKHRLDWYRALAKIANDGLPLFDALDRMAVQFAKTNHPLTPLVQTVLLRIRGAGAAKLTDQRRTLGTELMGMVPDSEAMLIQAGESSGNVAAGFTNAAELVEAKGALTASMIGALLTPVAYIAGLIGLLMWFSIKLLPKFEGSRPRDLWPYQAQLLGSIADHVYWIAGGVAVVLTAATVLLVWLSPNWATETREQFDRHVFPFNLIASLYGASLLTSIAGYINAGIPFADAVKNIGDAASPYIEMQCSKLTMFMKSGKRPEDALLELSLIHPRYHWIISVYGMSADASLAYKTIAQEMVASVQQFVHVIFKRYLSNLILAMVGGTLFWIYSAMFGIASSGVKVL
jgi:type II secretory pathway component PulF